MFDILISGGRIVDGTGNPAFPADLAIEGDRIVALGNLAGAEAKTTIDAAGRVVCPGVVDVHSHSDRTILGNREATSSIYQGVTTEIVGNCGMTYAPICDRSRKTFERFVSTLCPDICADWTTFGEFVTRVSEGIAVNLGLQVGHNALRRGVIGMDAREATEDEMNQMANMAAEALDQGAIGLSFGLEFMPGRSSNQEELRRLCTVAGRKHKMTSWHVRNRDRHFEEAVQEAIDVTKAAGAGLQLAHLSAKLGSTPRAWNRCMEQVRLANAQGHDIQCDSIAYVVGPGLLSTILPDWATQGTIPEFQARLRDPATRKKLIEQSDRYWLLIYYRQWDKLMLTGNRTHPEWTGKNFREIGEMAGKDPFDVIYDLLVEEGEAYGEVKVNGVLFSEGDMAEWMSDPLFSIESDGMTAKTSGPTTQFTFHPSIYGWVPTVVEKWVREVRLFSLETAIKKMTSQPASRFGLYDRGLLRAGMKADVIVFDEAKFKTRATYQKPAVYAEGMEYVFVNGRAAMEKGVPTGTLAGRVLG